MDKQAFEPSLKGEMPTKGFLVRILNHFMRDMFWNPTMLEIQEWVYFKALEFAQEKSEG